MVKAQQMADVKSFEFDVGEELLPSPLANAYVSLKQSTKVKQARTILLKTIATRREIDLNSTKKKMVGEILGPKILGHLYLLIEFTPQKIKLSLIFMTGGSFTTLIRTH